MHIQDDRERGLSHRLKLKAAWYRYILLLAVVALAMVSCRAPTPPPPVTPTPAAATPTPSPSPPPPSYEHPRLFFSAADIPEMRNAAETSHEEMWTYIEEFSNTLLSELPPETAPVDGDLDTYRNFGNQLIPLAFACVITDESTFCDQGKAYLLRYAAWDQWGNQGERDLGLAHMLIGNAIAYDWLYDRLSPDEREIVRQSLSSWTRKMYEASISDGDRTWNNWWTSAYAQNHYTTNNSALGIGALALLGEDDRAQVWVNHAAEQFSYMDVIWEGIGDGSWHEGLGYQAYGLTMALPFLYNLRLIQGVDLLPHTYLQNYGNWRLYNYLPGRESWLLSFGNFEWSWGISQQLNILRFVASEYGDDHAQWVADQLIAASGRYATVYAVPWYVLEFLYYDPDLPAQAPSGLPTARVFPDLEGVIWRTGWEQDDLVFGLKTGPYGGRFIFDTFTAGTYPWQPPCSETDCRLNYGHDHEDTNTFYLSRGGQWLAPEVVGVGNHETSFHNTILIDGEGQYRPSQEDETNPAAFQNRDGFLVATVNLPSYNYVAADATRRYSNIDGIRDVSRSVLFIRPDYLIMLDSLAADGPHQYTWVSHFGESVSVEGNWIRGDAGNDQILGVRVVSPESFVPNIGDDGRPYVHIRPSDPTYASRFVNILFPADAETWSSRPRVVAFTDTGDAVFLQISRGVEDEVTDEILMTYNGSGGEGIPSYSYDGKAAVITRDGNGSIQRLFLTGGTFLLDRATDEMMVSSPKEIHALEVTRSGTETTVTVDAEAPVEINIYAPDTETLTVNGEARPFTRRGDLLMFEVG